MADVPYPWRDVHDVDLVRRRSQYRLRQLVDASAFPRAAVEGLVPHVRAGDLADHRRHVRGVDEVPRLLPVPFDGERLL